MSTIIIKGRKWINRAVLSLSPRKMLPPIAIGAIGTGIDVYLIKIKQ